MENNDESHHRHSPAACQPGQPRRDPAADSPDLCQRSHQPAGPTSRQGNAGNPPRITQTSRFIRKHDEIPTGFWHDPRIKSAANCEACYRGAAKGNYNEHDIAIPELRE